MSERPEAPESEPRGTPADATRPAEHQVSSATSAPARWVAAGWARWLPPYTWVITAIWVVAIVVRVWPLNGVSTEYDEGVYWASLRAMAQGHPLFASVFSSQPPLFLLCLYPFYLLFGQTLQAARLGVVIYSLLGLGAIFIAGRALGGRWIGALALALLALDPLYAAESRTLQAEVPALAFALVSVALAVLAAQSASSRRRWLALAAGFALALGVTAKLFDVVAIVSVALYLLAPVGAILVDDAQRLRMPARDAWWPALRQAAPDVLVAVAGGLAGLAVVLIPFAGQWSALYDQVVRFHMAAGRAVDRGLTANIHLILNDGTELLLELVALALAGWALARRSWRVVPPALWVVASLWFLLAQQPLLSHHLTLLVPPLALTVAVALPALAGASVRTAERSTSSREGAVASPAVLAGALCAVALAAGLGVSLVQARQAAAAPERETVAALALAAATMPGDLVVTDDQYIAGLADRDVPPNLVDTSQVRLRAGYLTAQRLEAAAQGPDVRAVLFYTGRFDLVPGFRDWVAAHFLLAGTFGDHTALYLKLPHTPTPV